MEELQSVEGGADFRADRSESDALRIFFEAMKTRDTQQRDQAWARLQRLREPDVRAVIRSRVRGGREEIVDELVQEVFLNVFRSIKQYDPNRAGSFAAWVGRIADRRAVDYLRSTFGRHGKKPREESVEDLIGSGEIRGILEETRTPEEAALRSGAEDEVREAIAGLTPREREAVLLLEVLGLTGVQAGEVLGVTDGRVSQIRTGALERIRRRADTKPSIMPKEEYDALLHSLRERVRDVLGEELEQAA